MLNAQKIRFHSIKLSLKEKAKANLKLAVVMEIGAAIVGYVAVGQYIGTYALWCVGSFVALLVFIPHKDPVQKVGIVNPYASQISGSPIKQLHRPSLPQLQSSKIPFKPAFLQKQTPIVQEKEPEAPMEPSVLSLILAECKVVILDDIAFLYEKLVGKYDRKFLKKRGAAAIAAKVKTDEIQRGFDLMRGKRV